MEWWNALDFQMQFFWTVSIIGTVLFVIQLALNFLGHDFGADDITTDFELTAEFGIFSLRSLLAFATLFGWTGIVLLNEGYSLPVVILSSLIAGGVAMFSVAYLFFLFLKMQHKGSVFDPYATLGQVADVYLTIPADMKGMGKIHITIEGSFKELDAVSAELHPIATGQKIRIIDIKSDNVVVVEPLLSLEE
ncbi:MAG: NfeD family protein [Sphingobacteriales bacterium]|nr:MAG: NfeD family protein [Sphingobacteriales bacterium]